MDKQIANTIIGLVNGLECNLMRETFLKLQEDDEATNEQLVEDSMRWNTYLDAYCAVYNKMNMNKFKQ